MTRELDAAIARAKGDILSQQNGEYCVIRWVDSELYLELLPHYSTDGNDMLLLDKEMHQMEYRLMLERFPNGQVEAIYWDDAMKMVAHITEEPEPLARAIAAYNALSGKEWQE